MEVFAGHVSSSLNPNAPMFIPAAYRAVEDFSDQWWELVHSSPWFRDYWLRECFSDSQIDPPFLENIDPVLTGIDALFDDEDSSAAKTKEQKESSVRDLESLGLLKWRQVRTVSETPKYGEKAPKIVNVKVCPRPIQQPR